MPIHGRRGATTEPATSWKATQSTPSGCTRPGEPATRTTATLRLVTRTRAPGRVEAVRAYELDAAPLGWPTHTR